MPDPLFWNSVEPHIFSGFGDNWSNVEVTSAELSLAF
jgi:hypothetical protein